jgi:hypothetical protein
LFSHAETSAVRQRSLRGQRYLRPFL